jgi:hypothetical protein
MPSTKNTADGQRPQLAQCLDFTAVIPRFRKKLVARSDLNLFSPRTKNASGADAPFGSGFRP